MVEDVKDLERILEEMIRAGDVERVGKDQFRLTAKGLDHARTMITKEPEMYAWFCSMWWNSLVSVFQRTHNLYAFAEGLFFTADGKKSEIDFGPFLHEIVALFPKDEIMEERKWIIGNAGTFFGDENSS